MSEQVNNNEKKDNEKCQCTKKIMVLDKEIKSLKKQLEQQSKVIEIIRKSLKR